jgi:hypothetical protein
MDNDVSLGSSAYADSLSPPFDASDPADRSTLVALLVHLGDLSGQAGPERQRLNWSDRILAEFRSQASAERALGLPVAPFMAALDTPLQAARLQLSFVSSIVLPLWRGVAACRLLAVDGGAQSEPLRYVEESLRHYEAETLRLQHDEQSIELASS